MNKEFKIQITGMIDENKTIKEMNKQITKLEGQIKKLQLKLDAKQVKTSSNSFKALVFATFLVTLVATFEAFSLKKSIIAIASLLMFIFLLSV